MDTTKFKAATAESDAGVHNQRVTLRVVKIKAANCRGNGNKMWRVDVKMR